MVKPQYYDFFVRGLMPMQHYWPIRGDKKCQSIKFAVDWGNDKKEKVTLPSLSHSYYADYSTCIFVLVLLL